MGELEGRATAPRRGVIVLGACLLLALLALNTFSIYSLFTSRGNYVIWDLHPPLVAARAVLQGVDPYSNEVTESIQIMDYGRVAEEEEDAQAFAYPVFLAYLLVPLALPPLPWAQAVWLSLLEAALLVSAVAAIETWNWPARKLGKLGVVLWTMALFPFAWALILGQVSLPVCALIGTGFWLMLNGHDRTGGILLGLTIIKPNLVFLLVPGLVIWGYARGRRSFWRWMTGTMLVLLALPMPFTPDWILSFIRRLSEYSSYSPFSPPAVLVGRWFPPGVQLGATVGMVALVSAAVLFGWWEAARSEGRGPLSWAFGMSLLGAVWIAPQTSIVNQVVLLIPMLGILAILWRQGRPSRLIALSLILVWLVLFWCLVRIPPISTAEPRYPVEHRVLAPILPLTVGFFWVGLRRRLLGLAGGV